MGGFLGNAVFNGVAEATFEPVTLKPRRALGGITADAVIEEQHTDSLVIADHPVEQGSTISDHAYKQPSEVILTYAWSGGSSQNGTGDATFLQSLYQQVLQLQINRTLLSIVTGKRTYQNMLIANIYETTTFKTENVLSLRVVCREVLLATTQITQLSGAAQQALPNKTAPIVNQGTVNPAPASNFNPNPGGR